ncbi:chitinase [Madurella fahalii]|uniref:chitinase n=1 Tax=Madurella fahalii TaxID=1157608 RepID=A0ABQ0GJB0_9PEZI
MKALASLVLGAGLVRSAINLDGSQAVAPAGDDDPSPIHDPEAYDPDQHDCPLPCVDYANMHSWTPYISVDRLRRCEEPMLLQLSVTQPLDDPASAILIRSCTLGSRPPSGSVSFTLRKPLMGNPKKSEGLFRPKLDSAPACVAAATEVPGNVQMVVSTDSGTGTDRDVSSLLEGIEEFFGARDNCDENFVFAWHKQTVASVHIGAALGKPTVASVIRALAGRLRTESSVSNRTIVQLCASERQPERIFGIAIDTTGDLAALQRTALAWSKGSCAIGGDLKAAPDLTGLKIFEATGPTVDGINSTFSTTRFSRRSQSWGSQLDKRATCRYIRVIPGDSCGALVSRCGISAADFYKYNPKANLCATLRPDDFVCCSPGDLYKPESPKPSPDGTCATHLIQNGDSCDSLAKRYHVTVGDLERWNKGKTWAWTECREMLLGYNMCVSNGYAPLPPPQEGAQCGPLVPGTRPPADRSSPNALANLNPCPLKACCSNWGFCGPFPAHCEIHAPAGGGPGSKEKGYQSTCVSNCGTDIKINSGPPAAFQRIGYYESYNFKRDCLWLSAKGANTDGSYTHMHWAFAEIDPNSWKVVLKDPHNQWADFKALPNMKRIVAFGGWAYSTEPATFNIIRSAILDHGEVFATNIAKFLNDKGIDGVDIDWEYPGAPDIYVDGQPIGKKGDGAGYLAFLTTLKRKVGPGKSVSIAAPASFWYLRAFPIDQIAAQIDYIVYMTYDLHGQWDYGNANAYDSCPSGKCIRSHVNLTETRSTLSIITKAGVPNNKVFVGEASYGRAFHMAKDGCWGPCTRGYLALAEINEIIKRSGDNTLYFYDSESNTDILLYNGDYISYMTPASKETRRAELVSLNFAGSVDWAVDLQSFAEDDKGAPVTRPESGVGCVAGEDLTTNTDDLCYFTCRLGFCPESLCECTAVDVLEPLPAENTKINVTNIIAWDEDDVDIHRLCRFACKYGYCPDTVCTMRPVSRDDGVVTSDQSSVDMYDVRNGNQAKCILSDDTRNWHVSTAHCKRFCEPVLKAAREEGRTSNYGCMVWQPKGAPDPWYEINGMPGKYAGGECTCDNFLINEIADTVLEAMPIIAQFVPGVGQALSGGLDMLSTAAQMASYIYPEEEDPEGAFSWWLSPCGGTDLVPEDIKQVFGILSSLAEGVSSFRPPKNIDKGSAATTSKNRDDTGPATAAWSRQHNGPGWKDPVHRAHGRCDMDEYPPAYYLNNQHPAWIYGGQNDRRGQSVRYLPDKENQDAGRELFKATCFSPEVRRLSDREFVDRVARARGKVVVPKPHKTQTMAAVTVDYRPEFTIVAWGHAANPLPNDGLMTRWYNGQAPPFKYSEPYVPGQNGV